MDKAEGGLEGRADGAKAVGRGQDCGGVAKSVGAWPSAWGGAQSRGSVGKAFWGWSRPWVRSQG